MNDRNEIRGRILTVVALLCGSCAAGLFWKYYHPTRPSQITDARAIRSGFSSAADQEEEAKARAKYLDDMAHAHKFDAADMAFAERTLTQGSTSAKRLLLANLTHLHGEQQHHELLESFGQQRVPDNLRYRWTLVLQAWAKDEFDPHALSYLQSSPNPDISTIAKGLNSGRS